MPWIARIVAVIQHRRVPAIGGVEEPHCAVFAEFAQVSLHHRIDIAEQENIRPHRSAMLAFGDGVDRDLGLMWQAVFDLMGRMVATQNYGTMSGQQWLPLQTNTLSNGVYSLRIAVGDGFVTRKLVVQH